MLLKELKTALPGFLLCSAVFAADISMSIGAISILYILFVLLSFWTSSKYQYIVASVVSSVFLTIIGWVLQTKFVKSEINLGFVQAVVDYEGLFRAFSLFILIFVGVFLIRHKIKEIEIKKLNDSLELRILARTAAAEVKAKRLEKQIEILQTLNQNSTNKSLQRLDNVIDELKKLQKEL